MVQPLCVLCGIAQSVDVIESQSLQVAGCNQPRDQLMDRAECCRVFDANAREICDVEEPPVVHRGKRDAPICNSVVLAFEETMEKRSTRLTTIYSKASFN